MIETPGEELTFDQIRRMVGQLIVYDISTVSHKWYKVVLVEQIEQTDEGRRVVYYNGHRQGGKCNERYFNPACNHPARAYRLPPQTIKKEG